ncbi:hypothetical protein ACHAAC_09650 [Aeromicrobium sp. CF4.19]|uniref:hypothetical protein n=1 Tax=Aeromicrobium sp. CF4.19 TaxID=3373082 RepID=UPI003EE4F0E3
MTSDGDTSSAATNAVAAQLAEADAAVRVEAEGMDVGEVEDLARATFSVFMAVGDQEWLRSYAEDVHAGRPTTFRETPLGGA